MLLLYQIRSEERYRRALYLLRRQLKEQPRNHAGGFWHKQIYPRQMWLDGIYMAAPFYAAFGKTFAEPAAHDDVANQIIYIDCRMDDHIVPAGWNGANNGLGWWEYASTDLAGTPIDVSRRNSSRQLSEAQAATFREIIYVLGGWNPLAASVD